MAGWGVAGVCDGRVSMFRSAAAAGPEGSVLASFRAAGSGGSLRQLTAALRPGLPRRGRTGVARVRPAIGVR